jgi:hypothetical protein
MSAAFLGPPQTHKELVIIFSPLHAMVLEDIVSLISR